MKFAITCAMKMKDPNAAVLDKLCLSQGAKVVP
jgi:hypothetical protein